MLMANRIARTPHCDAFALQRGGRQFSLTVDSTSGTTALLDLLYYLDHYSDRIPLFAGY
jgi:hypothetical protein